MKEKVIPISLPSNLKITVYAVISFSAFVFPFLLGGPQILVGTMVNCYLFLAALFLPKKLSYSLIFFPSLGVISRGLIFGPYTPFLLILAPFIWISNWILQKSFYKTNSFVTAAFLKAIFLFSTANILIYLKIIPEFFLTSMGPIQLITALLGGILSQIFKSFYGSKQRV